MQIPLGPAVSQFRAARQEYTRSGAAEMTLIDILPMTPDWSGK
jgi:hypothetical protein